MMIGRFDASELGQHPVEQNDVGLALRHLQQGILAIGRDCDLIAFLDQVVADQLDQRRLVLDDQRIGSRCGRWTHDRALDLSCC